MNTRVYITGKTYECRNALKDAGWKYDGARKVWTKDAPEAETQRIAYGTYDATGRHTPTSAEEREEFARRIGGRRKGCAVYNDSHKLVWASETYSRTTRAADTSRAQDAHDRAWGEGRYGNVSDPDYL